MTIDDHRFMSIGQVQDQIKTGSVTGAEKKNTQQNLPVGENSFASILNKVRENADNNISTGELKFSKHAANRLNDREIVLTKDQMDRLNQGPIEASQKGIKDSLILVDQLAFIVNVPNHTVVTAMDQTETKNNIFTNIDGAVIV